MTMLARLRLLAVTLLLFILPVPAAWAHAQLLSTAPADNAILDVAPAAITLRFNEPVSPLAVKLISPDGAATAVEATGGATVTIAVPADLSRGTHLLSYRVVSTDGHPIGGALVFSVGEATGAVAPPTGDAAVAVMLWAGKAVLFLAMFVGIGGGVFLVIADLPAGARALSSGLSLAGLFAAVVTLGLQGLDALGLPLGSFLDGAAWSAAVSTSYGATAIVVGLACLAAFGALSTPPGREATGLGVSAGVLAALSLALSGHASAAAPQWLTRPAVFVHIAGVLFWVGALVPLWLLLRDRSVQADRALARFSTAIPFAVAPLVLSGLALAVVQLGLPGPQWLTGYGFILAAKLGLLVALFGLAAWNRRALTAPALAGDDCARHRLRRSIWVETVIVVVVLALVAGWRFTPPPRALATVVTAAPTAEPLMLHLGDTKSMAMVTISPAAASAAGLDIYLSDPTGQPRDAQSIVVTISSPQLGVEPLRHEATKHGDGGWRIEDFAIPLAGAWQMALEIRLSRFELATLSTAFVYPPVAEAEGQASPSDPALAFGDLAISRAFLRATLPNAPVGGAYLTITNTGAVNDRLLAAASPAARVVTLHDTELKDDIMRMRELADGIAIPAGGSIALEPSGMHLMLNALAGPLVEGTTVPVTLTFERAGVITLELPVAGFAATNPPAAVRCPTCP